MIEFRGVLLCKAAIANIFEQMGAESTHIVKQKPRVAQKIWICNHIYIQQTKRNKDVPVKEDLLYFSLGRSSVTESAVGAGVADGTETVF